MSERDELADIIKDVGEYIPGSHADDYVNPYKAADAILADGWRPPAHTIITTEELDALRLPAIINSPSGGPMKVEYYAGPGRQKYVEPIFADDDESDESYSITFFAEFGLPATVLYEPEVNQ